MIGQLQSFAQAAQSFGSKREKAVVLVASAATAGNGEGSIEARPLPGAAGRRRLRHVSQVALRGLELGAAALEAGYVLELAAPGAAEALERSDAFRTRNPTWEPACGITVGRQLPSFELRAVAAAAPSPATGGPGPTGALAGAPEAGTGAPKAPEALWRSVVRLAELESLQCEALEEHVGTPPVGVPLVQLGKEWYSHPGPAATTGAAAAPAATPEPPRRPVGARNAHPRQIQASEICGAGDHISAMISRLKDLKARSAALRASMEASLARRQEAAERSERRLRCESRVGRLRREVEVRSRTLAILRAHHHPGGGATGAAHDDDRHGAGAGAGPGVDECAAGVGEEAKLEVLRSNGDRPGEDVEAAKGPTLRPRLRQLEETNRQDNAANALAMYGDLQELWLQLRCRRVRMLREVSQVYPIENCGRTWTIRGLAVAGLEALARQDLREEESVSTALGWLTHLLSTLAGILEVPLRVAVLEAGSSRSWLSNQHETMEPTSWRCSTEQVLPNQQREWPLFYGRGVEKPRFETALRLLQDSFHQFLYSRGYLHEPRVYSNNLLECAELILRKETCPVPTDPLA